MKLQSVVIVSNINLPYVREVLPRVQWQPYSISVDVKCRCFYVAVNNEQLTCKVGDYTAGRVIVVNV